MATSAPFRSPSRSLFRYRPLRHRPLHRRRVILEVEALEDRSLMSITPISIVNMPSAFQQSFTFQVALDSSAAPPLVSPVQQSAYVEVLFGGGVNASGLQATDNGNALPVTLVSYDASGTPSLATHPLTGQPLTADPTRAGDTMAIVDCSSIDLNKGPESISFTGATMTGASADTSITAQGFLQTPDSPAAPAMTVSASATTAPAAPVSRELIVVDSDVENADQLVASLQSDPTKSYSVLYVNDGSDGVQQVADYLTETGLTFDAIQIISHGTDGSFQLGGSTIATTNAATFARPFATWGEFLSPDADILIYGCDVAQDQTGQDLCNLVANMTGADVAASTNKTGSPAVGGDWNLEYSTGPINVGIPFSAAVQQSWTGELGPTPVQTYFVPLPETQTRTSFLALNPSTGTQMNSVISIATTSPNTIIYYDQWEDGYEADIANPTQSTTQVWGDGNLANGVAPGYANDIIPIGGVVVLQNTITMPRNPSTIAYDGMDEIASTKAVAVTRAEWATNPGTVMGSAVDVYDTSNYGTAFQIPVGQNTPNANNMFDYTSLVVQASQDGTVINIDKDGNGTTDITTTLNKGQVYQVNGGVMQGATVTSSKPVQVQLITGRAGSNYESRSFTIAPTADWSNSYYSPVTTTSATAPLAIFLYNPGNTAITVNYQTQSGTGTINIAAHGSARFDVPQNSGVHFWTTGGETFWAVGTMDSDTANSTYDWGFRLVPESNLTPAAVVGWGPGSADGSANGSPVWVTATAPTTIYVDYDGDPTTGALIDPNGDHYDVSYNVAALQSIRIFDPDKNQTGLRVYTTDGTLITAAWGEDPSAAQAGNPFLDMGTIVPPLPVSSVKKTATVGDPGNNGAGPGDTITYNIVIKNDGVVPLGNVTVFDIVPIGTTYVPNSTVVTGNATVNGPVPDQTGGGATPFPLDNNGGADVGLNIGNIPVGGQATVSFTVTINNSGIPAGGIVNDAHVDSGGHLSTISVTTPIGSTPGQVVFGNASGSMTQAASYNENGSLFLTVTDPDPNIDPTVANTVTVIVTNPANGDRQTVTLTETGVNTGVFAATLPSSTSAGLGVEDGTLNAHAGDVLNVTYTDPTHSTDTSSDTVPIAAPSLTKQLYLSDDGGGSGQNLDRVDPTKTGTGQTDTTTAQTPVLSSVGIPDTITTGTTTTGTAVSTSSLTFSHDTGAGSNQIILVSVAIGGTTNSGSAGTVTGVTYGGQTMTLVNTVTSNAIKVYTYELTAPPSGTNNVVVTLSGNCSIDASATTFNNVDQTTPLGTSVTNFNAGNGTAGNVTVSSAAGQLVYATGAWDEGTSNQSIAAAAGQTALATFSGNDFVSMSVTTKPGAASVTSSWTSGDPQEYGAIGVPINPHVPAPTTSTTFTQTTPMASALTMPTGGVINVTTYVSVNSGSMPANPNITATLQYNGTTFATLTNPVYNSGAGTLTWSTALGGPVTIPAGATVTLTITTAQAGVSFRINYDSSAAPSLISLPTTTVIDVSSVGVYDAPFTNDGNNANNGNLITSTTNGQTVYIRAVVNDPFNAPDITSQSITITPPVGAPFSLTPTRIIPTGTAGQVIYEYAWTTSVGSGNYNISVRANEGFENTIFDTGGTTFTVNQVDTGTPSITRFTDNLGNDVTVYPLNSTIFVETTDIDQNLNPAAIDTVSVTITTSGGDVQTLTLTETGPNTGVFRGSVPSSTTTGGGANDGTLLAPDTTTLFVNYVDPNDATDQSGDIAFVRSTPLPPNNVPNAVDDVYGTFQNLPINTAAPGVLQNDSDPDANPLTVVAVNGNTLAIGNPVVLPSGAILTQQSNGSFVYNPNGVFDYLAEGSIAHDSYTYLLSDGNGGFDTATVTINIAGRNDNPISGPIPNQINQDSNPVAVNVAGSFVDPDAGDVLTFTAIGLPPGVTIDPLSGIISGTLGSSASVGSVYTVTVTATDTGGGSTSQAFTWTITNPPPTATNNSNSVTEDIALTASGNVITDNNGAGVDNDPDGDALTVSQMQFGATTVTDPAINIAGNYGTLDWNADGTYTYTLDNTNPAVQALNAGDTLTETFTYTLRDADGATTTATLTITINGQNDPRVLSVSNVTVTEGTDPFAVFTLSLDAPAANPTTVSLALADVSATGGGVDYGAPAAGNLQVSLDGGATWNDATSATFAAGVSSVLVRTPITDDAVDENTETFTLTATVTAGNITNSPQSGTGTILDDDPTPTLVINDVTVNEGAGTATFTVTLSAASGLPVSVDFTSNDGTATSPADFTAVSGTLNFTPGQTTQTITVPINNDNIYEGSENYTITLTNPTNATLADDTGVGTILDDGTGPGGNDNDTPSFTIGDVTVTEGTDPFAVFTVSLSNPSALTTTIDLALADQSATGGGVDYGTPGLGNLQVSTDGGATWNDATSATFAPGVTSVLVRTPITDDAIDENTETFTLTGTRSAGVTSNLTKSATGTILDDDPPPSITIDDVTVNEGAGTATFTVTLSGPSGLPIAVDYASASGTATAGADFGDVFGTLNFTPGQTTQTITVPITNDNVYEGSENYTINLANPVNATIADPTGVGTILDDGTGPGGNDDDRPTLSIGDVTVTEGTDPFAVFTLSLSNPSALSTTVDLTLTNQSATGGGVDYGTGGAGNLQVSTDGGATWNDAASATFAPGVTSVLVRTPIVDDLLDENTETFTLTATTSAGVTINPSATATGTILDNDNPPTISIDDVTVNEGAGTATFTVTLSGASGLPISVDFTSADGTATSPADFTAVSGTLNFAPGQTTQTITVPIVNDNVYEGSENYTITLSNPVNATIADDTGLGTILDDGTGPGGNDDDRPVLAVSNVTVTEGTDPFAVFTVSLSNPSVLSTTVNLALADITALGGGVDYGTGGAGNLQVSTDGGATWNDATSATFAPGVTSVLVRSPIVDDLLDENTETFTLTATTSAGVTLNPSATGTASILDDDPTPSFTIDDVVVNEGAGIATFTVTLSAPSGRPVSVDFTSNDGTATSPADFNAVSGTLNFAPGQTTQTIVVTINNDNVYEGSENYTITLSNPVDATIADDTGLGTILDDGTGPGGSDDDRPVLSIGDVTVTEGTDPFAVFTVSLSNPSAIPTTVGLALADQSALDGGVDYGTGGLGNLQVSLDGGATWNDAANVTFAPGVTSVLVRTPIVDDGIDENTETFTLTATTTAGVTINPFASATGTILDNDPPPSISINDVTVNEGAGTATFTVSLSGPSGLPISFDFASADGTAIAGADYGTVAGTLVFTPGQTTQTIVVPIVNDNLYEGSENYTITLTNVTNATVADDTGVGTILDDGTGPGGNDDDRPVLSVTNVTTTEGADPFAVFTVSLSNPSVLPTTVSLTLANVSALGGGVDYGTPGAGNLQVSLDGGATWNDAASATFAPGVTNFLVRTPITDDLLDENLETFTLTAATTAGVTKNPSATGTGTIQDNDPPPSITINDVTVNEGAGTATFTVTLSAPSGLPVQVNFTSADGAATSPADYGAVNGTLNFLAGQTTQTITVPIVNDNVYEGSEDYAIILSNAVNATIADGTGIGTILDDGTGPGGNDDDRPVLSVSNVTTTEGTDPFAVFTVSLSNPSDLPTTVDLTLTDVSALGAGVDYGTPGAGNLQVSLDGGATWNDAASVTFAPGVTNVLVRTPIVDDLLDENTETFTLTATTSAGVTLNPSSTGTGTILDDDPTPTLVINDITVNEGAGTATFTVTLSAPSGLPVSVDFTTNDGTATSPADYGAVAGTLNFAPGTTTQTITVPIVNDNLYEGSENYTITLSNATNAIITDDTGVGTILDDGTGPGGNDDDRPVLSVSNVTTTEGTDPFAVFTVSLSNPSVLPTTVSLALADITALGGSVDYGTPGVGNLQVSLDGGATWNDAASVTFAPGVTNVLVRTPITDDAIDENTETFTLTAATTAGVTLNPNATGTGTILDNDPPPSITINDVTVNEGAGTATFTVTLSGPSGLPISVDFGSADGTATALNDYGPVGGTLNFAPGQTTQTITVSIVNDNLYEGSENFTINLSNPTNATIADPTGVGTILDDGTGPGGNDDDRPILSVSNVTTTEGTDPFAVFTVSLSNPSVLPTTVSLTLANVTALGGGVDYGTPGAGNLQVSLDGGATWNDAASTTFAPGVTNVLVRTPITDDLLDENTETFTLTAATTAGVTLNPSSTGTGTILDDDPTPTLVINDVTVNEGAGTATFTVTLSAASGLPVSVDFTTNDGTATSPADYGTVSGTLNFIPGTTTQTITVPIVNDNLFEGSENYTITLSNAVNAIIADDTGVGTILDDGTGPGGNDDDRPVLAVTNVTTTEGTDPFAVFTVSLSNPSVLPTTVSLTLANVTALGGGVDYGTPGAGNLQVSLDGGATWNDAASVTFAPGVTNVLVRTPIVDDALDENAETFTLTAATTAGVTFNPNATGTGTILDDDPTPTLVIDDVTVNEGAGTATFTVTLSAPSGLPVSVDYGFTDGTATALDDFGPFGGTLNFAPGQTTQTITVVIVNDNLYEGSENYTVNLSNATNAIIADPAGLGTILDDGTGPGGNDDDRPVLSVTNVTTTEGTDPFAVFTVSLSNPSVLPTTVSLTLANVTALGGGVDYGTPGAGNLQVSLDGGATWNDASSTTFAPGVTSILVRTPVTDDLLDENTETFTLTAATTAGVTINPSSTGTGTILDNDPPPTISINDVTVNETAGTATFTVSLNTPSGLAVSVDYTTANGSATAPGDYAAAAGTLNFAPGQTTQTITVAIVNDSVFEPTETYTINLTNPTNATIADPTGLGTIIDNDATADKLTPADTTYSVGDLVTYDIVVTLGEGTTNGVVVDDILPAGLTFVSSSVQTTAGGSLANNFNGALSAPNVTNVGNDYSFGFGTIDVVSDGNPNNNSFILHVTAQVANVAGNTAGVTLVNNANISYTDGGNGTVTIADPTPPSITVVEPQISVTKTVDDATPHLGQVVTYTLTLTNSGANGATGYDLAVADSLPPGLTLVPGSLTVISAPAYATVTDTSSGNAAAATISQLNVGDTVQITYRATVTNNAALIGGTFGGGDDSITNTANLNYDSQPGANPNQRTYTAQGQQTVTVVGPDLAVTKTNNAASVTPGTTTSYTITVTNNGTDAATNVVVDDTLPASGVTFNAALSTAGATVANGHVTYNLPTLAVGASQSFTVVLNVNAVAPAGLNQITNSVAVSDTDIDPTPADNTASDTDTVTAAPNLVLTKSDGLSNVTPGSTITYTLTLTNAGNQDATGVTLVDTLPSNVTFVSASSGGVVSGNTITWNIGNVAGGNSQTITRTVTVRVNSTVPSGLTQITNSAVAQDDGNNGADSAPADNTATDTDTVDAAPDLVVTKTDGTNAAIPGQTLTYTITISNTGNQDATGVVVTDTLPALTTFVSASNGGTVNNGVVTYPTFNLAAGQTVTRTVTVQVAATIPPNTPGITNSATATDDGSNGPDLNPANNTGTDFNSTGPDLALEKQVTPGSVFVGDFVTYVFTIHNLGPGVATGVVVNDPFPAGLEFIDAGTPTLGTYDVATNTWNIGTMQPGTTEHLTITARVQHEGPVTNNASVGLVEIDPNLSNNSSSAISAGTVRTATDVSKRLFFAQPIFESDLLPLPSGDAAIAAVTGAASPASSPVSNPTLRGTSPISVALPSAAGAVSASTTDASSPIFVAPLATSTPTNQTPANIAIAASIPAGSLAGETADDGSDALARLFPDVGDLFSIGDVWPDRGDGAIRPVGVEWEFNFELPLNADLFDSGIEIYQESGAVSDVFTQSEEPIMTWDEVMARAAAEDAEDIRNSGEFGKEVLDEVGIPPMLSLEEETEASPMVAAAMALPAVLLLAEASSKRTSPTDDRRKRGTSK